MSAIVRELNGGGLLRERGGWAMTMERGSTCARGERMSELLQSSVPHSYLSHSSSSSLQHPLVEHVNEPRTLKFNTSTSNSQDKKDWC